LRIIPSCFLPLRLTGINYFRLPHRTKQTKQKINEKNEKTFYSQVCFGGFVLEDGRVLSGVLAVDVVDGQLVNGSSNDDVVFVAVLERSISSVPLDCSVVDRQFTLERHRVRDLVRLLVLQLAYPRET